MYLLALYLKIIFPLYLRKIIKHKELRNNHTYQWKYYWSHSQRSQCPRKYCNDFLPKKYFTLFKKTFSRDANIYEFHPKHKIWPHLNFRAPVKPIYLIGFDGLVLCLCYRSLYYNVDAGARKFKCGQILCFGWNS